MAVDRIQELVAMIADGVTATEEQLRGLTPSELHEVEFGQSAPLAATYRRFLELVGRGAGHFLAGSGVFYPVVLGLGEAARELLAENEVPFTLAHTDRVILMHQGYQFDFLRGSDPDPEVWSYCEGTLEKPIMTHSHFSEWLAAQVKEQTEVWAQLVPWYEAEKRKPPGVPRVTFYRRNPDGSRTEMQ
jgi:hypothetical protein